MGYQSFDDFENDENGGGDYVPFQFREDKTDKGTLLWLNDNFDQVYQSSLDRLMTYQRFSNRYKNGGDSTTGGYMRDTHRDYGVGASGNKPRVRTNFFYQYVDQKVSTLARMKLNLRFIPHNDTQQDDINDAEACQMLVDFRMRQVDFRQLMSKQDRVTFKYGTSFLKIFWDKCAGPVHPNFRDIKAKKGKVEVIDENGKPTGKKLSQFDTRIGDVGLKVLDPDCIYPERRKVRWEDIDYVDEVEFVSIHELKEHYPVKGYYHLDI